MSCKLCARRGRYRLARLAARYGPDQPLDGLLADLAHTCPYWRSKPRRYEARCGARFEDLDRLRPQDVPPQGAARERVPARESLPQRRTADAATSGQPRTLSTWQGETFAIACVKCGLRDTYVIRDLIATEGDARLTDVLARLTAGCPRVAKGDMSDWCGARFEA